jgi:hypothetical protein
MSRLRERTFDPHREFRDTHRHKRQHNRHKIQRCARPFGVQAIWTIPRPTPQTLYGPSWTNTTGHILTYVRARVVAGRHTSDHPDDGCPQGAPGLIAQILLAKNDSTVLDTPSLYAHGIFAEFPSAHRLHIPGTPPYHHRDTVEADVFDGPACNGGTEGNDGPIILPDQSLAVLTRGVGHTPARNVVITLWMEVVEATELIAPTPPPDLSNDAFADAIELIGLNDESWGDNTGYTTQASEPGPFGGPYASAWWFWDCPSSGDYTVSLIGSTFDTTLGVYTGTAVGSLTEIATDDDSGGGGTSELTFTATSGTTYHFQVDGSSGDTGLIVIGIDAV